MSIAGALTKARKVGQRASRLLRRPDPRRVRRMTLAVSWLCDCRCRMCDIWKIYAHQPALRKGELTSDERLDLLANASALRSLETVTLTGGEPFIHKEVVGFCLALQRRSRGLVIDITTTGQATQLIGEKLQALRDSGGDLSRVHVCVSLDGVGATHDEVRRKRGAFDRAMATLDVLRGFPLGSVALGFTILPSNYRTLEAAYALAVERGVGFTMRVAHFNDGIYANSAGASEHVWTPEAIAAVEASVRAIIEHKRRSRRALEVLFSSDLYFAEQMLSYLRAPRRLMPCYSGTHSLFLDPFGNVSPCVNLEHKMGQARERGLDAVWFSNESEKIRQFIADARCHCWTECEAFLSFQTSPAYLIYNLKALWRRPRATPFEAASR